MRLLLFFNNWGSWQLARWLRQQREEVVGVVVQPDDNQRFAPEILEALNLPSDRVWKAPQLRDPASVARMRDLQPEMGISSFFGYVLKPDVLSMLPLGCINLHTGYLPFNRGWHTNVWPIIDGSPAGVTIHYIDEGVDTGDIIAQRGIAVEPTDTGGSLHQRLTRELVAFFQQTWPLVKRGDHVRTPQNSWVGSIHKKAELPRIDQFHLETRYRARDLINLLRARTYPPYPGAYFVGDTGKTFVRVTLEGSADEGRGSPTLSSADSAHIDLDRGYTAQELLKLLATGERGAHFDDFGHGRRIYIRARQLSDGDVDAQGTPVWD